MINTNGLMEQSEIRPKVGTEELARILKDNNGKKINVSDANLAGEILNNVVDMSNSNLTGMSKLEDVYDNYTKVSGTGITKTAIRNGALDYFNRVISNDDLNSNKYSGLFNSVRGKVKDKSLVSDDSYPQLPLVQGVLMPFVWNLLPGTVRPLGAPLAYKEAFTQALIGEPFTPIAGYRLTNVRTDSMLQYTDEGSIGTMQSMSTLWRWLSALQFRMNIRESDKENWTNNKQGLNTLVEKMSAAFYANDWLMNQIAHLGYGGSNGLGGFLTDTSLPAAIPLATTGNTSWVNMTAEEVIKSLTDVVMPAIPKRLFVSARKFKLKIIMPPAWVTALAKANPYQSAYVMNWFNERFIDVEMVEDWNLVNSGPGATQGSASTIDQIYFIIENGEAGGFTNFKYFTNNISQTLVNAHTCDKLMVGYKRDITYSELSFMSGTFGLWFYYPEFVFRFYGTTV